MADQRTDLQNVHAGGDVTVAPVQIVAGATGSAVRGWTEALLQGPLKHAGLSERAEEAQRLRDEGDSARAAAEFEAVAEGLVDAGYEDAAETYLDRSASAYAEGADRGRARELYLRLARRTLGDGSLDAQGHARHARDLWTADNAWEANALLACAAWPERQPDDLPAVRLAWEQTRGTEAEIEWASRFVELAILSEEAADEALEIASATREGHPLAVGARLHLELDFLDLTEDDADRVDAEWAGVSAFLSDPRLSVEASGTAWQRRGVALARRGLADEAHAAFLQAVGQWARLPGYDDQAAEAYFSGVSAQLALGDFSLATDTAARSLARALRGSRPTETARVERLLRQGMRALVNQKFPDAFRLLSVAMSTARRAGNLSDFFEASEALGDCLAATGKYGGAALQAYVKAGGVAKAKKLTEGEMVDDVLTVSSVSGPRWERAAAWAAVAGCGRTLSDAAAATVTESALTELAREPARAFPTNAAFYALEALASAICAVPQNRREEILAILRERLAVGLGDPGSLHEPFQAVTKVGLADETETLVDAMLADSLSRPRGPELAGLLDENAEQLARITAAAREGHAEALKALAFSDRLDDPEVSAQATRCVEAVIAAPLRDVHDGGVAYGIGGSVAAEGLYARTRPVSTRSTPSTRPTSRSLRGLAPSRRFRMSRLRCPPTRSRKWRPVLAT
jgi:hypothetical protein